MPLFSQKAVQNAFFRKNTSHARSSAFCLGIFCKKSVFDKRVPPKNDHFRSFSGYPQNSEKTRFFVVFFDICSAETRSRRDRISRGCLTCSRQEYPHRPRYVFN